VFSKTAHSGSDRHMCRWKHSSEKDLAFQNRAFKRRDMCYPLSVIIVIMTIMFLSSLCSFRIGNGLPGSIRTL
jgi:hypothetical protein